MYIYILKLYIFTFETFIFDFLHRSKLFMFFFSYMTIWRSVIRYYIACNDNFARCSTFGNGAWRAHEGRMDPNKTTPPPPTPNEGLRLRPK